MFNQTAQKYSSSLLQILKQNNELNLLPQIIQCLKKEANKHALIRRIEVITHSPLKPATLNLLAKTLKKRLNAEIEIMPIVDPSILGGIMLKIDDKLYDLSFKTKLAALNKALQ